MTTLPYSPPYSGHHRPTRIEKVPGDIITASTEWCWTCVCGTRGLAETREAAVTALRRHAGAKRGDA